MTDKQPTSSVNLFRPSTSSLTPANNALDIIGLKPTNNNSFSQELSRASERADSFNDPSKWRQDTPRDSAQQSSRSNQASDSTRSSDTSEASTRSDGTPRETVNEERRSESSADSTRSSDASDTVDTDDRRANGVGKRTEHSATNNAQSDADNGTAQSVDVIERQSDSNTTTRVGISAEDASALEAIQIEVSGSGSEIQLNPEETIAGSAYPEDGEEAALIDEQLTTNLPATAQTEDSLLAQESDKRVSDTSGLGVTAVPTSGVRSVVDSASLSGLVTDLASESISNVSKPYSNRLTMGEQLSPAELANRQAAMLSTSGNRDRDGVGNLTAGVDSGQNAIEVPLSRSISAVSSTNSVPGLQSGLGGVNLAVNDGMTEAEGRLGVEGLQLSQKEGSQNAKQVVERDIQLQADAQKELLARKLEQESTASSLMQSKQLAQQQLQSAVLASTTGDNSSQTTDNMFHSLPGGIVTAPVLQRADVGNMQTINAPVNMPIFQNDADKALTSNIRWMVNEGVKSAVVNVTPSGMGPISVSIGLENEQMNVSIVALQGATREALDSMLPRLREQLTAQGHDIVKVDISDGRSEQSDRGYSQQSSGEQGGAESGFNSLGTESSAAGLGNDDSDDQQLVNVPIQGALTLDNGQTRSIYDVYV